MDIDILTALRLSLMVALSSTVLILPIGLALGWLMARRTWRGT